MGPKPTPCSNQMPMRLVLLLVFLSGCGRWTGVSAARREVVSDGLQAQHFPLHLYDAALRMPEGVTRCERQPTGKVTCGGCFRNRCFQFLEEEGATRIATKAELTEAELISIWKPLDANSLATLRSELDGRVQDKLIEQEQRFVPRWGVTIGVLAGFTTEVSALGRVMVGGRVGLRRWFDAHLLGHLAAEYRFRGGHELSFRVGLEVARWTDGRLWGAVGVPGVSVAMFSGPLFRFAEAFRSALVGELPIGLRTGVGLHLTDIPSAPLFVEFAADTHFAGGASEVVGTFTVGVGL